jgi:hypothetical protein
MTEDNIIQFSKGTFKPVEGVDKEVSSDEFNKKLHDEVLNGLDKVGELVRNAEDVTGGMFIYMSEDGALGGAILGSPSLHKLHMILSFYQHKLLGILEEDFTE